MKKLFTILFISLQLSTLSFSQGIKSEADSLIKLGDKHFAENSFLEATDLFKTAYDSYKKELNKEGEIQALINLAQVSKKIGDFQESQKLCKEIAQISDANGLNELKAVGTAYYLRSVAFYYQSHIDSSIYYCNQAIEHHLNNLPNSDPALSKYKNSLGVFYNKNGQIDKAIELQHQSLDIRLVMDSINHKDVLISYYSLGNSYNAVSNLNKALTYYDKALVYYEEHQIDDENLKAHTLNSVGVVLHENNEYDSANEHYQRALSLFTEYSPENYISIAKVYDNIGNNYASLSNYKKAFEYHFKSLSLIKDNNLRGELYWKYFNLASTYSSTKEYGKALEYLNESYDICVETSGEKGELLTMILNEKAQIFIYIKEYEKARTQLKISEQLARETYGEHHYDLGKSYFLWAESFLAEKKYKQCLTEVEKTISSLIPNHDLGREINLDDDIISNNILFDCLLLKQEALWGIWNLNQRPKDLLTIFQTSLKTEELAHNILNLHRHKGSMISFFDKVDKNINSGLKSSYELYQNTMSREYIEQALQLMEDEKSFLLRKSLIENQAKYFSGIPKEILIKEEELKGEIAHYQKLIFDVNDKESTQVKNWQDKVFDSKRNLEVLIKNLETNFPKYYELKYQKQFKNISDIQNSLSLDECIVEYFKAAEEVYTICINKEKLSFYKVEAKQLSQDISDFGKAISSFDKSTFIQTSHSLYQALVEPIKGELKSKITLIPSKDIAYISFDALISTLSDSLEAYNQLSYLVKDYTIHYKNSSQSISVDQQKFKNTYLGIAPNYENTDYANLLGAEKEVMHISKNTGGDVLISDEATEEKLLEHIDNYRIIHFAAHAEINHQNPSFSRLILQNSQDSLEDNLLHAYEIYNMHIPSELVVLSACNTGIGTIQKGEGLNSLARSFNYAGVPSVVMSLWALPDFSTSVIIQDFFKELSRHKDKGLSLQEAKLKYLNMADKNTANPIFWAGLVLIGEEAPIQANPINHMFIGIIILLLVGLFVSYRLKRV